MLWSHIRIARRSSRIIKGEGRKLSIASSTPDWATGVFVLALVIGSARLQSHVWSLESQLETAQEETKTARRASEAARAASHTATTAHQVEQARLAEANKRIQKLLTDIRDKEQEFLRERSKVSKFENSIFVRGGAGEAILKQLVVALKEEGRIADFQLQPTLETKQRPDAIVHFHGGRTVIVDSKAPSPLVMEDRQQYTKIIKGHVFQLSQKNYTSPNSIAETWMLLPTEGYVQALYDPKTLRDVDNVHDYATERKVKVVGPEGFRSAILQVNVGVAEQQALEQQQNDATLDELHTLSVMWEKESRPGFRMVGKKLEKLVEQYDIQRKSFRKFDEALQSTLTMKKPRANQNPTKVPLPVIDEAEGPIQ